MIAFLQLPLSSRFLIVASYRTDFRVFLKHSSFFLLLHLLLGGHGEALQPARHVAQALLERRHKVSLAETVRNTQR